MVKGPVPEAQAETGPDNAAPKHSSAPPTEPAKNSSKPTQVLDESKVTAMLFELRAEEVPITRSLNRVTIAAGALSLLIGTVLVIWAIVMMVVATRRPEQAKAGLVVGTMVFMFGAGFAGAGAWFVFRTLRQQGVL